MLVGGKAMEGQLCNSLMLGSHILLLCLSRFVL